MSLQDLNVEYQETLRLRTPTPKEKVSSAIYRLKSNTVGSILNRRAYPDEDRLEEILLDLE
jgi:hypothetical protein